MTKELLDRLTARKLIYVIPATYREQLLVRFVIGSRLCEEKDILFAWNEILGQAKEILQAKPSVLPPTVEAKKKEHTSKAIGQMTTRIEDLKLSNKEATQKIS